MVRAIAVYLEGLLVVCSFGLVSAAVERNTPFRVVSYVCECVCVRCVVYVCMCMCVRACGCTCHTCELSGGGGYCKGKTGGAESAREA